MIYFGHSVLRGVSYFRSQRPILIEIPNVSTPENPIPDRIEEVYKIRMVSSSLNYLQLDDVERETELFPNEKAWSSGLELFLPAIFCSHRQASNAQRHLSSTTHKE